MSTTTCDLYHFGNNPPAAPDLAALPIVLTGDYARGRLEAGESRSSSLRYTHVARLPPGSDVRDGFSAGLTGGTHDALYVPDQSGTRFDVVFVEKTADGGRKVYLNRRTPNWPGSDL